MREEPFDDGRIDRNRAPDGAVKTGTTTLAAAGADGVVLAADRRASVGGGRFVANRSVRKVEPVADRTAVAFAGGVADAQSFLRRLRVASRRYELERDRPASVETTATVAGALVRRGPFRALSLLVAGVDDEPAVYDVGPGGGVMRADYAAAGSGMQLAYGALERAYEPGLPVADLRAVAANAVRSATERDTASGDGLTLATIAADGVDVEVVDRATAVPGDANGDAAGSEVA